MKQYTQKNTIVYFFGLNVDSFEFWRACHWNIVLVNLKNKNFKAFVSTLKQRRGIKTTKKTFVKLHSLFSRFFKIEKDFSILCSGIKLIFCRTT